MLSCGQNSCLDEDSDYCSIHSNEGEHDMAVNMRIMMAGVESVEIYNYNPQNHRVFLRRHLKIVSSLTPQTFRYYS